MPSGLKLYTIVPSLFFFLPTTLPSGGWLAASNISCRRRQYDSNNKYRRRPTHLSIHHDYHYYCRYHHYGHDLQWRRFGCYA